MGVYVVFLQHFLCLCKQQNRDLHIITLTETAGGYLLPSNGCTESHQSQGEAISKGCHNQVELMLAAVGLTRPVQARK